MNQDVQLVRCVDGAHAPFPNFSFGEVSSHISGNLETVLANFQLFDLTLPGGQ